MQLQIIAWIVAGVSGFVCLALWMRARGFEERADAVAKDLSSAQKEARELRKQLERQTRKQDARGEDASDLRRRLEKAKKRVAQLQQQQRDEPARIATLEDQLAAARSQLESAREEVGDLGHELGKLRAKAQAPAPAAAPPPAPEPAVPDRASEAAAEADALRAKLAGVSVELGKARADLEQARSRIKTQDKLYLAMRGELEAKKDRLKQQQEELERLLALRVALGASEPEPETPAADASSS